MKLIVKRISGADCAIEVRDKDAVTTLKKMVEEELCAPAHAVRLVFKGRTLTDDKTVHDCGLKEGDKLYAVIKKDQIGTPPPDSHTSTKPTTLPTSKTCPLWTEVHKLLKKHFHEEDALKVLREFQKDFDQTIASLSLDDIERLATVNLEARR